MSAEPVDPRPGKDCRRCHERRQIHQFPKLAPGRYGDTCRVCVRRTKKAPALRVVPSPVRTDRVCAICDKPKTIRAFRRIQIGEYAETCRACEKRVGDEPQVPSGKRLCIVCGPQPPARFARDERGRVAEACQACCGEPEVRVLVRHEVTAARVLRGLRQIASGRLDCAAGAPTLGNDGLRQIAADLLAAVERAKCKN